MYAIGSGDECTAQNVWIKEQSQALRCSDLLWSLKCAIPVMCVYKLITVYVVKNTTVYV